MSIKLIFDWCEMFQHVVNSSFTCCRTEGGDGQHIHPERNGVTNQALAEACKFAYNDARFVNERARNDIFLLSR